MNLKELHRLIEITLEVNEALGLDSERTKVCLNESRDGENHYVEAKASIINTKTNYEVALVFTYE